MNEKLNQNPFDETTNTVAKTIAISDSNKEDNGKMSITYIQEQRVETADYSVAIPDGFRYKLTGENNFIAWLPNKNKPEDDIVSIIRISDEGLRTNAIKTIKGKENKALYHEYMFWTSRLSLEPIGILDHDIVNNEYTIGLNTIFKGFNGYSCRITLQEGKKQRDFQVYYSADDINHEDFKEIALNWANQYVPKLKMKDEIGLNDPKLSSKGLSESRVNRVISCISDEYSSLAVRKNLMENIAIEKYRYYSVHEKASYADLESEVTSVLEDIGEHIEALADRTSKLLEEISKNNADNNLLIDLHKKVNEVFIEEDSLKLVLDENEITYIMPNYSCVKKRFWTKEMQTLLEIQKEEEERKRQEEEAKRKAELQRIAEEKERHQLIEQFITKVNRYKITAEIKYLCLVNRFTTVLQYYTYEKQNEEERQQAELKRIAAEEERNRQEEEMKRQMAEINIRKKKREDNLLALEKEITEQISVIDEKFEKELSDAIDKFNYIKSNLQNRIDGLNITIQEKRNRLQKLGFFKFSEKNKLKAEIEASEKICSQLENDIRTEEEKLKVKRLELQSAMDDRKQVIYGTERGWQYKVLEILQNEAKGKSIVELINSNKVWNGQDIICQQAVDELIALDLIEEVWLNGQKVFKKAEELAFYDRN